MNKQTASPRFMSYLIFICEPLCFVQIYRPLHGDAMLVSPGGNQHGGHGKPTLRSYARKVCIHHSRNSTNTRFNTRTRQEAKSKKKHSFDVYDSSRRAI